MPLHPPSSTLFPYTTLFRSISCASAGSDILRTNVPQRSSLRFCRLCFCARSEEHTSELQSRFDLVCRLLLEKKNRRCHGASRTWRMLFTCCLCPSSSIAGLD